MQPLANESALITRLMLANDQQAFSQLVQHYQQSVRQYCRRLAKQDHALADDLAQDTFWQAYRNIGQFQGKGKFLGWLLRIAYFQFLQHLRARKDYQTLEDETLHDIDYSDTVLIRRDLETAMAKLSINERACLTLQYTFGYSQDEISLLLEMPLGTVKSYCRRGKNKLTKLLALESATTEPDENKREEYERTR